MQGGVRLVAGRAVPLIPLTPARFSSDCQLASEYMSNFMRVTSWFAGCVHMQREEGRKRVPAVSVVTGGECQADGVEEFSGGVVNQPLHCALGYSVG